MNRNHSHVYLDHSLIYVARIAHVHLNIDFKTIECVRFPLYKHVPLPKVVTVNDKLNSDS